MSAAQTAKVVKSAKVQNVGKKVNPNKRVKYPTIGSKDPNVYPFTTVPADFSFKTNLPLSRKDFKDKGAFLDYKVSQVENILKRVTEARDEWKKTGGKGVGIVNRFKKMADKFAAIRAEIEAAGFNPDELLAAEQAATQAAKQ